MPAEMTHSRVERAALVLIIVLVAVSLSRVRATSNASVALPTLIWYVGVIAAARLLLVRLPGRLELTPVASAVALGIALTPTHLEDVIDAPGWAAVGLMSVAGLLIGQLIHWRWSGAAMRATPMLGTAVGAVTAAVIYRDIPIFDGTSASFQWANWQEHRWRSAVMMLFAAAIGAAVESVITTAGIQVDPSSHVTIRSAAVAIAPLSVAVVCTATMIGLGTAPLGLVAVPLMAAPLVLVRVALEQQRKARAQRDSTIETFGRFTDVAGFTSGGHAERVRALCQLVARDTHTSDNQAAALGEAALLHDLGQVSLRIPIPEGATVEAAPVDQHDIAALGSQLTAIGDSSADVVSIVEHQAVPYRQVREFGEDVPMASRILKVCNAYDDFTGGRAQARPAAVERLSLGLGYEFDPEVVEVLLRVTQGE